MVNKYKKNFRKTPMKGLILTLEKEKKEIWFLRLLNSSLASSPPCPVSININVTFDEDLQLSTISLKWSQVIN